jgi:hypothetical protein
MNSEYRISNKQYPMSKAKLLPPCLRAQFESAFIRVYQRLMPNAGQSEEKSTPNLTTFMQNKANLSKVEMNVTSIRKRDYEEKSWF